MTIPNSLLSLNQVVANYKITRSWILRCHRKGKIVGKIYCRRLYFDRQEVEELIRVLKPKYRVEHTKLHPAWIPGIRPNLKVTKREVIDTSEIREDDKVSEYVEVTTKDTDAAIIKQILDMPLRQLIRMVVRGRKRQLATKAA
jgi:hypothetical protein